MAHFNKILLFGFALLLFSSLKAEQPGFEVKGSIIDESSGVNLKGVRVYLELNGEVLLETKTNKDGSFLFNLPQEQIKAEGIKVRVEKSGYKSKVFQAIPGQDLELNVQLKANKKQVPIMVPKISPTAQYIIV